VQSAMDPDIIVCDVKVNKFSPSMYVDAQVLFDRDSYNSNHLSYDKVKMNLEEYANREDNNVTSGSIGVGDCAETSSTTDFRVSKVLWVTFMCIVFEVLWQMY
ncbi:unnamed protein product, partial [Calicophoron daubneyi]